MVLLGWVGSGLPLLHELQDGRPLVGVAALLVAHLGSEILPFLFVGISKVFFSLTLEN